MSLEKILDDYKLVIFEYIPLKEPQNGVLYRPQEITREELLKVIGNDAFGEVIKWEDKKEKNVAMEIVSTDKRTEESRYFKICWKRHCIYFEG